MKTLNPHFNALMRRSKKDLLKAAKKILKLSDEVMPLYECMTKDMIIIAMAEYITKREMKKPE